MKWSRRYTAGAGLALILAVNVIALAGVSYNRSGEPESVLRLTERELRRPQQTWGFERENSGLALKLRWRVRPHEAGKRDLYQPYMDQYGEPAWLDRAKLVELGIEVPEAGHDVRSERRLRKITSKEVLLVLELDGPDYRAVLDFAREQADRARLEASANPRDVNLRSRAETAAKHLALEETLGTRLFVIDAGREVQVLRAKYPDRTRYAIVGGRIQPRFQGDGRFGAYIQALSIEEVNVPLDLRPALERAPSEYQYEPFIGPGFEAKLAYGKRLEPWLAAATRR